MKNTMFCLFDSIAKFVHLTQKELRVLLRDERIRNKDRDYNGLPLRDWIRFETGKTVEDYAQGVHDSGWGGILDVTVLADALGCSIMVRGKGFSFNVGKGKTRVVLRYSPGHWSSLFK